MGLTEYRRKHNFQVTSEPRGGQTVSHRTLSFVIQKHAASHLHYDFRLELDGVLKSWAVPKGPSLNPATKRLAMHVEDHPLEYGGFEGVVPQGEYGGGTVMLWDRGTWEPQGDPNEDCRDGKLKFELHGEKLQGGWMLVRKGQSIGAPGAGRPRSWSAAASRRRSSCSRSWPRGSGASGRCSSRAARAGDRRDSSSRLCRAALAAVGDDLDAGVFVHGATPDAPARLADYDVAIVLGESQGCPNAVLEALAAGVPVVANDSGGTRELILHGRTGLLLRERDPAAVAAAVTRLLLDPALAPRCPRPAVLTSRARSR